MPTTGRYGNIKKPNLSLDEVGYSKFWLNLVDDFTTLQTPAAGTVLGDSKKIATAHTWAANKGAMELYVDENTLEAPGDTVGDKGNLRLKWTPKLFLPGDGPEVEELLENLKNLPLIGFAQDGCDNTKQLLQYGNADLPLKITKVSPSSGTLTGGKKGWMIETECYNRYFYNATLTVRA